MFILGIDPGSRSTGWAIIQKKGRKLTYLRSGTICLNPKDNFFIRLQDLSSQIDGLLASYPINCLALESLIHVKNVSSLSKLAQARGAIISRFSQDISIFEYSPNLIKSCASGYGHATKESIQKGLEMIFKANSIEFSSYDESDALAIALCHAQHEGLNLKPQKSARKGQSLKSAFKHLESS